MWPVGRVLSKFRASGKSQIAERRQKKRQLPHERRTFALSQPKSLATALINLDQYRASDQILLVGERPNAKTVLSD